MCRKQYVVTLPLNPSSSLARLYQSLTVRSEYVTFRLLAKMYWSRLSLEPAPISSTHREGGMTSLRARPLVASRNFGERSSFTSGISLGAR